MRRFLFSIRPEANELPVQQRVNLVVLYTVAVVSLFVVPYQFVGDWFDGNRLALMVEAAYVALITGALGLFWSSRNLRHARTVMGLAIFGLASYLVIVAGGVRGVGLFYFLSAFPFLYFVLGYRSGVAFVVLFFLGIAGRLLLFPLPHRSLFADPLVQGRLLMVFAASTALGIVAAVYQHSLIAFLSKLAYEDPVTGLATRTRIAEHLDLAVRSSSPFFLIGIRIHDFDEVSAHWGMAAGDRALRTTGDRIQAELPQGALAGRWSGTFFVARLPGTDRADALHLGRTLLTRVREPQPGHPFDLTLQAGVAVTQHPEDGTTVDRLMANVMLALHEKDAVGRVRLFDEDAWRADKRRFLLAESLRGAVDRRELSLAYQPKVSLPERRPVGAEVLLRWNHPDLGAVSPGEFVPIAEASGAIRELTWFVVERLLEDWPLLRASGVDPGGPLAMNLSPVDLSQPFFADRLRDRLRSVGMSPSQLQLEITEGIMLSPTPTVESVLKGLKAAGFPLVIDDFGTGFSSLSSLYRLQADCLKIDQSFLHRLGSVSSMPPIVDAVLSMGRALKLGVVAEGVETEAQAAYLVERGCPCAQGFLFSKPLPFQEYLRWLT